MVYITGDTHGNFRQFNGGTLFNKFPEQDSLTEDDFVIILGDTGLVWDPRGHVRPPELWWLNYFEKKPYTLLFVDGNHENFDRLNGDEFEVVDFHGGKAHKIRDGIYHLMRGEIFELEGKTFFVFGGGESHDIVDGVLNQEDYPDRETLIRDVNLRTARGQFLRVNHVDWWKEELPTDEEMTHALENLAGHNNKVDFVLTHSAPREISTLAGTTETNILTEFLDEVMERITFEKWYFGHHHKNKNVTPKFTLLYDKVERII